jgi:hypothetical protein
MSIGVSRAHLGTWVAERQVSSVASAPRGSVLDCGVRAGGDTALAHAGRVESPAPGS